MLKRQDEQDNLHLNVERPTFFGYVKRGWGVVMRKISEFSIYCETMKQKGKAMQSQGWHDLKEAISKK